MESLNTLLSIIDRPRQALGRVVERPRSWWLPALLLFAGLAALAIVTGPDQVALANERSAALLARIAQQMTTEQAEQIRAAASEQTLGSYLMATLAGGGVMIALGWLLRGGIIHFSSMAFGGASNWGSTFAMAVWSMIPFLFRDLFQIGYYTLTRQLIEHQGLSALVASADWMRNTRSVKYAALSNVDPFVIWHLILLSIGISIATKLGKTASIAMAVVVWLVFLALKLVPVILSTSLMGG